MLKLCHSAFARVTTFKSESEFFIVSLATAHSRGLRRGRQNCNSGLCQPCHSAFARVTTQPFMFGHPYTKTLPQRIRAGYDRLAGKRFVTMAPCHSAFARVTTPLAFKLRVRLEPCHSAFARVTTAEKQCSALRICCEKVDSFSSVGESGLALTIFPFSFAAKATYVAINDSFGRAIDRFFWCEPHRN